MAVVNAAAFVLEPRDRSGLSPGFRRPSSRHRPASRCDDVAVVVLQQVDEGVAAGMSTLMSVPIGCFPRAARIAPPPRCGGMFERNISDGIA
ncbi:MAG: hypothetical protein OXH52_09990 [Gammaproteobacteria bacterium]|nr:hypothetical protein [Gammaproteobacteria bacterium]